MRVLHVVPSYPPTSKTGPPAAVHRLCQALRADAVDARVATTDDSGSSRCPVTVGQWTTHAGVPVFYGKRLGWRGDISAGLHRCINREVPGFDLVHVTAVYSWPLLSVHRICRRSRTPYVVSPRGSLAPAALAWRPSKKRLFTRLGGASALRHASGFHATSEQEAAHVMSWIPGARVGVVPNGTDVPGDAVLDHLRREGRDSSVLFLGRLHPHKNPELLLRAWARAVGGQPAASLIFAGPDVEGLAAHLRALAVELGCASRVQFPGAVDGEAKARLLARARVVVLPSKSENFGNVVAEALAHGTPAIATHGTPWQEIETRRCGWWVTCDEDALSAALAEAMSLDLSGIDAMGRRGREWVTRSFSWDAAAGRMASFYREVLAES